MDSLWTRVQDGCPEALVECYEQMVNDDKYRRYRYCGGDEDGWQRDLVGDITISISNFDAEKFKTDFDYAWEFTDTHLMQFFEIYEYARYRLKDDPLGMHVTQDMHDALCNYLN